MPTEKKQLEPDESLVEITTKDGTKEAPGISGTLLKNYFLEKRLPELDEFKNVIEDESTLKKIYELFIQKGSELAEEASASHKNEKAVRDHFIDRLLNEDILGFAFNPETPVEGKAIDYALYLNDGHRSHAQNSQNSYYENCAAILEAKYWGRPLDREIGRESPSNQIINYLYDIGLNFEETVEWGILSNGVEWRLYDRQDQSRQRYVSFDFTDMVENEESFEQWKYTLAIWKLIFESTSFDTSTSNHGERSFLKFLLDEGENYEERVQESIKEHVFTQVFPSLARGIYRYIKNNPIEIKHPELHQSTDQIIDDYLEGDYDEKEYLRLMAIVRRSTNVLLYRLLFLAYAEDRHLLPLENKNYYRDFSFKKIQIEIEEEGRENYGTTTRLWESLQRLFDALNEGSPKTHNLPAYNGGLFEPGEHKLLEQVEITDEFLAPAVDYLVRDFNEEGNPRINFRDLNERQLGSLYEGLLEFRVHVADEPMVLDEGKVIPKTEADSDEVVYEAGELYWVNDDQERKSTGSYYTPDFVVKYIVENTVGELVTEIREEFEAQARTLKNEGVSKEDAYEQLQEYDPAMNILDLDVLDPAMGSGHFLVEAVNYLTLSMRNDLNFEINEESGKPNQLEEFLQDYRSPLSEKIEEQRQSIQENIKAQGLDLDEGRLDDPHLIRRMVLKQCIYGVDLNPMAVELGKLSLWLNSFTVGAPLSFLDHHLRCGNSLIGSTLSEVEQEIKEGEAGKMSFESMFFDEIRESLDELIKVTTNSDTTLEEVEKSKFHYKKASGDLLPLKKFLDFKSIQYFGEKSGCELIQKNVQLARDLVNDPDETIKNRKSMVERGSKGGWTKTREKNEQKINELLQIAKNRRKYLYAENRFFHWELEFPEVFFDKAGLRKEDEGFDALVSNPPYIKIQNIRKTNPDFATYLDEKFFSSTGRFDIYACFAEESTKKLNDSGRMSFILPNKFFVSDAGEGLRDYLTRKKLLEEIIDFGNFQIFKEVTTYTCILTLERNSSRFHYGKIKKQPEQIEDLKRIELTEYQIDEFGDNKWALVTEKEKNVLEKIEESSVKLGKISDRISEGIVTGGNKYFLVELIEKGEEISTVKNESLDRSFKIENDLIHPIATGNSVSRFDNLVPEKFIIYPYENKGLETEILSESQLRDNFPKGYSYLKSVKDGLSSRGSDSMEYEDWFGLWCPRHKDVFEAEKIIVPDVCERCEFTIDDEGGFYFLDTAYGIVPSVDNQNYMKFLLGVLNSSVTWFYISKTSSILRGDFFRFKTSYLTPLPVFDVQEQLKDNFFRKENFGDGKKAEELIQSDSDEKIKQKINDSYKETCIQLIIRLVEESIKTRKDLRALNLNFSDYLRSYDDGEKLGSISLPPDGISESVLNKTKDELDNLKLERIQFSEQNGNLILSGSVKYKPDDPEQFETDQYGYVETENYPCFEFHDLSREEQGLIKAFVPYAVEKGSGFANFRKKATKTKSILDRLEDLTLPKLNDIKDSLQKYLQVKEKAETLDSINQKIDFLIDQILYRLYDLTDEEIQIVEQMPQ